ncbi:alpha-2-macroglobulin-like protein, partial [Plakobranchus ocellatus]
WLWKKKNHFKSSMDHVRFVRQWFSPSRSYIQLPKIHSPQLCYGRLNITVLYTTRAKSEVQLLYQVMARGHAVMTDQLDPNAIATPGAGPAKPPPHMCLQRDNGPRNTRQLDDVITDPEREQFSKTIQKRQDLYAPIVLSPNVSDKVFNFPINFKIMHDMSPKFTLLMYYMREDDELVADSMEYDVKPCFETQVSLESGPKRAFARERVNLTVQTAPHAICSIGAVGKDVPQFTPANIFDKIGEYAHPLYGRNKVFYPADHRFCLKQLKKIPGAVKPGDRSSRFSSEYVDSLQAFKTSGFLVGTHFDLESRPCLKIDDLEAQFPVGYEDTFENHFSVYEDMSEMNNELPLMRYFIETWFWTAAKASPEGEIVLSEPAPDTLSYWSAKALCVSKNKGFGISGVTTLTTFNPISVQLHQPSAAVMGEIFPVLVTATINLKKKCFQILLTLEFDPHFTVRVVQGDPVCVCDGEPHSEKFSIASNGIGSMPLNAKATIIAEGCRASRDTGLGYTGMYDKVQKNVLIKAEGVEQSYTHTSYLCSQDGKPILEEVRLELPKEKEMVRNSARGDVHVTGDFMGAAPINLENLVRMPTGCGEQNMIGFVSNILVLNYLKSIGKLQEATWRTALKNIEKGT